MKPVKVWKLAYASALLAFCAYALSGYPPAAARFAELWNGGARLSPFDHRLHKPAVVYAVEKSGSELKVLIHRTYAQPAIQDLTIRLTLFNSDGETNVYVFRRRAPPGCSIEYAVHAPLAVGLRVEIEVDGWREVEERWFRGS